MNYKQTQKNLLKRKKMATQNETFKTPSGEPLTITRIFKAPRALVWKAWTDPTHMMKWWGPKSYTTPVCKIDLRVGGKYLACMQSAEGQQFWSTGEYKEIIPNERLVMSDSFADEHGNKVPASHYGMENFASELIVAVTFEEIEGKTKLTMQHWGLPASEMAEVTGKGWNEMFDKLADMAISMDPSAIEEKEFTISRIFNAPREVIFNVFTDPKHLAHWWGPKGFTIGIKKLDLKPGGVFHYYMETPDGGKMWGKFVYREIVAPERVVFVNSFSDENEGITRHPGAEDWPLEMLSTVTLTAKGNQTLFTITGKPLHATPEEINIFDANHDSMEQGFGGTFDQLDEYLSTL
jgi:uncharacterized protein YndB with AHSA1/START domain